MVTLLASSAQPRRRLRRENISKSKTLNVQHTFWQVSLPSLLDERCQTWLKWQCNRCTSTGSDLFCISRQQFCPKFQSNRLYNSKEAKQYIFLIVKTFWEGKGLTSGWRPSLKKCLRLSSLSLRSSLHQWRSISSEIPIQKLSIHLSVSFSLLLLVCRYPDFFWTEALEI